MKMCAALKALSQEQLDHYNREGYLIVKGLFTEAELAEIDESFEVVHQLSVPGYHEPDLESDDPLKQYPRFVHPHRYNDTAKKYMIHKPVMNVLADLYGEEPLAAQSMYYYKPPGSRGQALHQDNFYLQVEPGNCIAAWTSIDAADEENGGLLVVPKTSDYAIVCPEVADANESFTTHFVKPPKDGSVMPAVMDRGDVLFFNGNLIHGSYRNKTKDRFRRAFISHYASASTTHINNYYRPLYREDGTEVMPEASTDGGPCGVEVDVAYPH